MTATRASASEPPEFVAPVLLAGLAAGLLGQGGYAGRPRVILAVLVAAAWLLTIRGPARVAYSRRVTPARVALGAAGLLAGWALVDGAVHGHVRAGAGAALLAVGVAVAFSTGRRIPAASRDMLVGGLVAVGLVIASAGWVGVALRVPAWAWQAQGVWRASSMLSYPNATAAMLAPLALLLLARLTVQRSVLLGLAATGLLIGLGATASRAGLLAAAAGFAVLATMRGPRPALRAAAGPVLGAAVAVAGLLPSMPAGMPARPALAAAALAAGLLVAGVLPRLPARHAVLLAGTVAAAAVGGLAASGSAGGLRVVAAARTTLASPDRVDGLRAAFRLIAASPLVGTGPGDARLRWTSASGATGTMPYVHNEYVQVTTELGTIGALLLAGLLIALAAALRTARGSGDPGALRAGVAAGTTAFAVHSAFDFVWHIPAIPLLVAALVGLATQPRLGAGPNLASADPADRAPSDGTPVPPLLARGPIPPVPTPSREESP